ncbi:MAG: DUF1572 domain-containing protein [Bacteroidota bacterium]
MNLAKQVASGLQEVFLDGKWVAFTNIKEQISDLNWEQATTSIEGLNSIALLTFHLNYYAAGLIQVLEGGPLEMRDKYSYDMPPITSEEDWIALKEKCFTDAERLVELVQELPQEVLEGSFVAEKYGNYYRNLLGTVEHTYYHFGQMVIIKKLVLARSAE